MNYGRIIATGSYTPSKVVTNNDLEDLVKTSDEWIQTRTGIRTRRITEGENTSELSTKAAQKAIKKAGIEVEDIDLIIVATVTPDSFTPSTACLVQSKIGANNATSFDISAGCTGFVYGLNIANQFINTGKSKTALVIGTEVLSKVTNWNDRNTCVLFGDGAGAVILQESEESGVKSVYTGSEGDIDGSLKIPGITVKNPFVKDVKENESHIYMNGKEIFRFATKIMKKSINEVLKDEKISLDDIKYIIPHQANYRIINYTAAKMKIDKEKFYLNLDKYGNTSSASIPIALDEMANKNLLEEGDKLIFVAFGGGLTWGSILLEW